MTSRSTLRLAGHLDDPEEKRRFNEALFAEVAPRYAVAVRALSLGRDAAWKDQLVARLPEGRIECCLDLACGTGDITFRLARKYPQARVVGVDLTESMLALARRRSDASRIQFVRQDMARLEFPAAVADIVTGGYALRNAPGLERALAEIARVMKPGATAAFLDFSKPAQPLLQVLEDGLLRIWGGWWGWLLHRNPEVYRYIAASLRRFPDRRQLRRVLGEHGFQVTGAQRFYGGILELLVLRKA